MSILVTVEGIDQAITSLSLTPDTQKTKLIAAIRSRLADQEVLGEITEIAVDELIEDIWGEGDAAAIKSRRKSFSSLKSALNKSLKELDAQGLNPEGVIIGRNNVFEVSEEHKNALLDKLGVGSQADGGRMAEMFASFKKVYPDSAREQGMKELTNLFQGLEEAKALIAGLRREVQEKDRQIVGLQKTINSQVHQGGVDDGGLSGGLGIEPVTEGGQLESRDGIDVFDVKGGEVEDVEIVEVEESELGEPGGEVGLGGEQGGALAEG
ncbi:MAG: hypothetical protein KKD63_14150, partial [Proteobacteria bacterium]|nr:hypothetical protein [Pseudomonadota bacterium]